MATHQAGLQECQVVKARVPPGCRRRILSMGEREYAWGYR